MHREKVLLHINFVVTPILKPARECIPTSHLAQMAFQDFTVYDILNFSMLCIIIIRTIKTS